MTSKPSQGALVVKPSSGLFVGRLIALWTSREKEMLGTPPMRSSIILRRDLGFRASHPQTGMYGPPPFCKRRMRMTELVCANVFGLDWSSELLA